MRKYILFALLLIGAYILDRLFPIDFGIVVQTADFGISAGVAGILSAAIGATVAATSAGISGGVQGVSNKRQAERLERNIRFLKEKLERQEIKKDEALKRLNTMVKQTSGDLRKQLGRAISDSIKNFTAQYENALRVGTQKISDAMLGRRLGGSEAFMAETGKVEEGLAKQYSEGVANVQSQGLAKMMEAISALKQGAYSQGEAIEQDFSDFEITMDKEILQLENVAEQLASQGGGKLFGLGFLEGTGGSQSTQSFIDSLFTQFTDPQTNRNN